MKEFIEKLIGRLEDTRWTTIFDTSCIFENDKLDKCIQIVNQLAEEYKEQTIDVSELVGKSEWIPYATDCKMPNEASRVWLSFTTPIASFVKSAWYINGHFEWDNCRRVKETPMAWKPYDVPAPYQPNGCI